MCHLLALLHEVSYFLIFFVSLCASFLICFFAFLTYSPSLWGGALCWEKMYIISIVVCDTMVRLERMWKKEREKSEWWASGMFGVESICVIRMVIFDDSDLSKASKMNYNSTAMNHNGISLLSSSATTEQNCAPWVVEPHISSSLGHFVIRFCYLAASSERRRRCWPIHPMPPYRKYYEGSVPSNSEWWGTHSHNKW